MKRLLLIQLAFILCYNISAQSNLKGIWEGTINVGVEIRMVFHIQDSANSITATLDIPDQGIEGVPATTIKQTNDSILIEIEKFHGQYKGKRTSDSSISGVWDQGRPLTLSLKRVKEITMPKRPQTPVPPYPYSSEDVVYTNADHSIQYGATITIPKGKGPFPALLLLTGSGQQNRDEEILGHRPFAVLADYLTKKGYVVLRVDDRGMGKTTGELINATTKDFADDAAVSLNYLKKRKEVDQKHIGLLGHSEGGMIAEMLASKRTDIDFIILLAAPGEKITMLMEDQNAAVLRSIGMSQKYIDTFMLFYKQVLRIITTASTLDSAKMSVSKLMDDWISKTDRNIVIATTGVNNESAKKQYVNDLVTALYGSWYRYFLKFDPAFYLNKIKSKVLALNGDKDIQVVSKTNLPAMEAALKNSSSKVVTIKEVKGVNHLFQHCKTCTVLEYGRLEETFAMEVLEMISDWLNVNVKSASDKSKFIP